MYEDIVSSLGRRLVVHIDRDVPRATVFYTIRGRERATCFQTLHMPADNESTAAMVNEWLDSQGGGTAPATRS